MFVLCGCGTPSAAVEMSFFSPTNRWLASRKRLVSPCFACRARSAISQREKAAERGQRPRPPTSRFSTIPNLPCCFFDHSSVVDREARGEHTILVLIVFWSVGVASTLVLLRLLTFTMMTETNAQACSSSRLVSPRARTTVEILDLALGMRALACDGEVDCPFSSPPLDEVTLYSSTETDCSSTCSSEYLEGEGDSCSLSVVSSCSATPRSIFQAYWEKQHAKNTEATINLIERPSSPDVSESSSSSEDSTQASSGGARPNHQRRRRRIFSDGGSGPAALPQDAVSLVAALRTLRGENRKPRKTQSSPTFSSNGSSKPASCLRSKRCRSDSTMSSSSSSSSSVTFSPQVDVVYFERPKELWASDGWSKFFSS